MNDKFAGILIAIVLIAMTGVIASKSFIINIPDTSVPSISAGGSSGQYESFPKFFGAGFTSGGRVASSTTNATETLLSSTLENATTLDYTLNRVDSTLTLPASSTIGFIRDVGDTKTFYIRNATTTAAMDITFAAGTGLNLKKATSTAVLVGNTDGGNTARLTFIRQADSDIDVILEQFLD